MLALLRSEVFRLRRRSLPLILLAVLSIVLVLFYLLTWFVVRNPIEGMDMASQDPTQFKEELRVAAVRDVGLDRVQQFGTTVVVVLAASIVATEFSWGTIRTLLPRSAGRVPFLTAKLIVAALFTVTAVLAGYVASLGTSAGITWIEGLDGSLGGDVAFQTTAALFRTVYVMLPYVALAVLVSLWSRSSAAGISVTLAVLFLEPVIIVLLDAAGGGAVEHLPDAFLSRNVAAVLEANAMNGATEQRGPFFSAAALPSAWQASAVLAAYIAGFIGLSYWRFLTRDIAVE